MATTSALATAFSITAANVVSLFPDVVPLAVQTSSADSKDSNDSKAAKDWGDAKAAKDLKDSKDSREPKDTKGLEGYDEEQIRLMGEVCIVLDFNDNPIGSASKKTCHLMTNIQRGLLHRAFSVFLFDSRGRLLLQQRASEKITFPNMWTNTCCSHPLAVPGETGAELTTAVAGVRRAAQRKLDQELGIRAAQVPLEGMRFLTRIHYLAPSDGLWGEHEVDYILFITADVEVAANPNEVQATRYVTAEELKAMFEDQTLMFTPWFKLICESMLFEWWSHLNSLEPFLNEKQIRRM